MAELLPKPASEKIAQKQAFEHLYPGNLWNEHTNMTDTLSIQCKPLNFVV